MGAVSLLRRCLCAVEEGCTLPLRVLSAWFVVRVLCLSVDDPKHGDDAQKYSPRAVAFFEILLQRALGRIEPALHNQRNKSLQKLTQ